MKKIILFLIFIAAGMTLINSNVFGLDIVARGNKFWSGGMQGCDWQNNRICVIKV